MLTQNKYPIAVLISDIHYNENTIELADYALRMAVEKANVYSTPLILAGDLHDTKAFIHAKCLDAISNTLDLCKTPVYILTGNHCRIEAKSPKHALRSLAKNPNIKIIETPIIKDKLLNISFIPYQDSAEEFVKILWQIPPKTIVIAHQGLIGANQGHYIQDPTAVRLEDVSNWRIISGHYHNRHSINNFSYIGNPFTLTFGEAYDSEKGFQILNADGSLTFVPTNMRKHVIWEIDLSTDSLNPPKIDANDEVWVKIKGRQSELDAVNKKEFGLKFLGRDNYRLDLTPIDSKLEYDVLTKSLNPVEILDSLIDDLNETDDRKEKLKNLYKELLK